MHVLREVKKCQHCEKVFEVGSPAPTFTSHLRWCEKHPKNIGKLGKNSWGSTLKEKQCSVCKNTFIGNYRQEHCNSEECISTYKKHS